MFKSLLLSILVFLLMAGATVVAWWSLRTHDHEQIATIVDSTSWSTRSHLARSFSTIEEALDGVHEFWSQYASLPPEQWEVDARIELLHFDGLQFILWDMQQGDVRFLHSKERSGFSYRPTQEEWQDYADIVTRLRAADSNSTHGPLGSDGGQLLEVFIKNGGGAGEGGLAAVVVLRDVLERMLMDIAPGFVVAVYSGDQLLYKRGQRPERTERAWQSEGEIKVFGDRYFRIMVVPERETQDRIMSSAGDLILVLGLMISVLMAALVHSVAKLRRRAVSAEAARQELARLNEILEQADVARTRELVSRNADLQTITDSVGHDLRNPLNVIGVNTQLMMQRAAKDGQGTEVLERITSAVSQMAHILDRLIGLSSIGYKTFDPESIDMEALVRQVYEAEVASEEPPEVQLEVGDLPPAEGDRKLVEMLLTNLVSNAVKFTRGQETRKLRFSGTPRDGLVVWNFEDNGPGFEEQAQERLFEAFHSTTGGDSVSGIGLGLTIVSRVVERHGGWIRAESGPGQGARFLFTLEPSPLEALDE